MSVTIVKCDFCGAGYVKQVGQSHKAGGAKPFSVWLMWGDYDDEFEWDAEMALIYIDASACKLCAHSIGEKSKRLFYKSLPGDYVNAERNWLVPTRPGPFGCPSNANFMNRIEAAERALERHVQSVLRRTLKFVSSPRFEALMSGQMERRGAHYYFLKENRRAMDAVVGEHLSFMAAVR